MSGMMGTAIYNFGGKTWPAFYYSTRVARNTGYAANNMIQQWIQFRDWDSKAIATQSYFNEVVLSTFTSATVATHTFA